MTANRFAWRRDPQTDPFVLRSSRRSAVKGYIRKSNVLYAMKDFDKAYAAIEEVRPCSPTLALSRSGLTPFIGSQAMEKDESNAHTKEISQQFSKVTQALSSSRAGETDEQTYARAMRDPEVQQIMSDPVFQSILQQAQQDPKSLQQHMMQNEGVRKKVEVLVRAVSLRARFGLLLIREYRTAADTTYA